MAIMLTTSYQKVSTIPLTYGEIRTYARYGSQSIGNNETYWQIKCTYYTYQAGGVSFSSGRAGLDGTWKDYGYTTMPKGETTLIEAYRTTKHNTDGSSPTRALPTAWSATFGGGGSTSVNVVFPKINRYATLTSAPDFNDEQNPTIKYSNPAGNSSAISSLQACIASTDGNTIYVPYRDISKTGTSYTFNLTNAERNTLRNATPNSNTMAIKYYVRTIISGTQYGSTSQKTLTITNANPTFTHTELETNSVVSDALGTTSASTIVKNLSKIKITITPSAKKGATIKKVELTHNGTTYSDTTSPYEFTITPTANKFDVKVTDSRGNVGTGTITKTLLNYEPVKINSFSFKRNNPTGSNIIINLDATYWNTNIGSVTNAPVVKWKMDNGSWNTIPSSSVTIDNTNHKIKVTNYTLTNQLVYTSGATFYISVNDAYSDVNRNQVVTKGIPVLDLGDNEVQVNGDLYVGNTSGGDVINALEKLQSKARAELTDANITHKYENNKAHLQFLVATGSMTSNKPAGDGYILHCSWDNSGQHVGQLYIPNTSTRTIQFRGCSAGTWGDWENLYRTKVLYNSTSGTTGNITLSETVANFEYIEIFFAKDRASNKTGMSSVKVPRALSSYASLVIYYNDTNKPQLLGKNVYINGTSITHQSGYYMNFTASGVTTGSTNEIKIFRVVGYR